MKSFFIPLTLLLAMIVTSCGKKAKEKDSVTPNKIDPSVEEIYFNAFKEIKAALEKKDEETFIKIITENPGIDLNQILTRTGETFLTTSIKQNLNNIRVFLLEKGVSVEKTNVMKETPLIAAVKAKNEVVVRVLLDRKVDLEKKNLDEDTALHVALKNANDKIAVMLIKQGASVHTFDKNNNNAQALAEKYQTKEALELINSILDMEFGAPDINSFRIIIQKADQQTLRNVLSRYPKVASDKIYQAINPLALLVDSKNEINALATAELLIKYDANVNGPDEAEITPLIKASMASKKGFAGLYLNHNADPQFKDKHGKTALIHAIEQNNEEIVNLLVSKHADVEYKFRRSDGRMIKIDACDAVYEVAKSLTSGREKEKNRRIKESLDCNILSRLF